MLEQKEVIDILKSEWSHCEAGIARYDTLVFQVRTWAVTVSAGLVAAALSGKIPIILIVSAASPILFLCIEAQNKVFQSVFIGRSRDIQDELRAVITGSASNDSTRPFPGIDLAFDRIYGTNTWMHYIEIGRMITNPAVFLFYLTMTIVCLVCYIITIIVI